MVTVSTSGVYSGISAFKLRCDIDYSDRFFLFYIVTSACYFYIIYISVFVTIQYSKLHGIP
jgi:hypothetical protein